MFESFKAVDISKVNVPEILTSNQPSESGFYVVTKPDAKEALAVAKLALERLEGTGLGVSGFEAKILKGPDSFIPAILYKTDSGLQAGLVTGQQTFEVMNIVFSGSNALNSNVADTAQWGIQVASPFQRAGESLLGGAIFTLGNPSVRA